MDKQLIEATAKAIHDHWKNNLTPWEETCEKLPGAADFFRDSATAAVNAVHEALQPVAWRYWDEDEESWLLCGTDPTDFCATTAGYSKPEQLFALSSSPLGKGE